MFFKKLIHYFNSLHVETYGKERKKLSWVRLGLAQAWIKLLRIVRLARKFSNRSAGVQIISERSIKILVSLVLNLKASFWYLYC